MKFLKAFLIVVLILAVGAAITAYVLKGKYDAYLATPKGSLEGDAKAYLAKNLDDGTLPAGVARVEIPRGVTPGRLEKRLAGAGVLVPSRFFWFHLKRAKLLPKVKAGTYLLSAGWSPVQILRRLTRGEVATFGFTVAEGLRATQIAEVVEKSGLAKRDEFMAATHDKALLEKFGVAPIRVPEPDKAEIRWSAEGYLYPDTYRFARGVTARALVAAMLERFRREWTKEMAARAKELDFTEQQAVTLASIVERETASPDERPLVSSVFHNRMAKHMKLETDPTAIYGMGDSFTGTPRDAVHTRTAYNTYYIHGLPPGPIANPGKTALRAALWPKDTKYLFFVARDAGHHTFTATLADHERAIDAYRRFMRQR